MSVRYTVENGCARITLDDPARGHPINAEVTAALADAARNARRDGARVVVLSSTGRFFCTGGDLSALGNSSEPDRYLDDAAHDFHRFISELLAGSAVVVSSVQGPAVGGGLSLAAVADIVIASESASFMLGYTKLGLSVDGGASMLVHTFGLHRALRMALLNDTLSAREALEAGLVARVVSHDQLSPATEELVEQLLSGSLDAYASCRRLFRDAAEPAADTRLRAEALQLCERARSDEGRAGIAAASAQARERRPRNQA
ncbi:MAG: enoyl-CoA hydratase/isomerase family protein [Propionibacteriales bacterium]|nr:enoyl-CoA hydratase/isomerase family protein [Propionibacteriales bacterium]